jgi:hypothetical protein
MSIPPPAIERQILQAARDIRAALVRELAATVRPGDSVTAICDQITAAIDQYSTTLLDDLIAAVQPLSMPDTAWIRDQYLELMLELATDACNLARQSGARHTVAQAVQCTILQHEQRLRSVLESALSSDH